jgi:hypothetical protein
MNNGGGILANPAGHLEPDHDIQAWTPTTM